MTLGGRGGKKRAGRGAPGLSKELVYRSLLEWSSLQVLLKLTTRGYVRFISACTDRRTYPHAWPVM